MQLFYCILSLSDLLLVVQNDVIKRVPHGSYRHTSTVIANYMINVLHTFERDSNWNIKPCLLRLRNHLSGNRIRKARGMISIKVVHYQTDVTS